MIGGMRDLSKEDEADLKRLNAAVTEAIETRTKWLDEKMAEYCLFKPGDMVYSYETCTRLGKVTELFRYHRGSLYDTSVDCDLRFETAPRCFNNTCADSIWVCTADEAKEELRRRAENI